MEKEEGEKGGRRELACRGGRREEDGSSKPYQIRQAGKTTFLGDLPNKDPPCTPINLFSGINFLLEPLIRFCTLLETLIRFLRAHSFIS
jgi:hypothetical protein